MNFASVATAILLVTAPAAAFADGHGDHSEEKVEAPLSLDTPIEQLVADEAAKAILEKHIPGISQHPSYEQFKALSLRTVQPFSQGAITPEMLDAIAADLEKL
ncbi:MAG: hypothetical protein AAGK02_01945 [Pseudomonadota bacterium]